MGRLRSGKLGKVIAVTALGSVLAVPAAFAFRSQILDLIEGDPAPRKVAQQFERWNVIQGPGSSIRVDGSRGVMALKTPGGTVTLWDAPQEGAVGKCWLVSFGDNASAGSCERSAPVSALAVQTYWSRELPAVWIVHVRVHAATGVELQLGNGSTEELKVVRGHALAAVPLAGGPPRLVLAKDAKGATVGSWPVHVPRGVSADGKSGPCIAMSSSAGSGRMSGSAGGSCGATARPPGTSIAFGQIVALTRSSITVEASGVATTQHGIGVPPRNCSRAAESPSLAGYRVGELVLIECAKGVLTMIRGPLSSPNGRAGSGPATEPSGPSRR